MDGHFISPQESERLRSINSLKAVQSTSLIPEPLVKKVCILMMIITKTILIYLFQRKKLKKRVISVSSENLTRTDGVVETSSNNVDGENIEEFKDRIIGIREQHSGEWLTEFADNFVENEEPPKKKKRKKHARKKSKTDKIKHVSKSIEEGNPDDDSTSNMRFSDLEGIKFTVSRKTGEYFEEKVLHVTNDTLVEYSLTSEKFLAHKMEIKLTEIKHTMITLDITNEPLVHIDYFKEEEPSEEVRKLFYRFDDEKLANEFIDTLPKLSMEEKTKEDNELVPKEAEKEVIVESSDTEPEIDEIIIVTEEPLITNSQLDRVELNYRKKDIDTNLLSHLEDEYFSSEENFEYLLVCCYLQFQSGESEQRCALILTTTHLYIFLPVMYKKDIHLQCKFKYQLSDLVSVVNGLFLQWFRISIANSDSEQVFITRDHHSTHTFLRKLQRATASFKAELEESDNIPPLVFGNLNRNILKDITKNVFNSHEANEILENYFMAFLDTGEKCKKNHVKGCCNPSTLQGMISIFLFF